MGSISESLSNANFNLENLAKGFRSGIGNGRYFSKTAKNIHEDRPFQFFFATTWKVGKTLLKAYHISEKLGQFQDRKKTAILSAAIFTVNNLVILVDSCKYDRYTMKKEYALATPAIVLISNIALTALEFRLNPAKSIFSLTFIVIGAFNEFELLPTVHSTALRILSPCMTAASFYYGNKISRTVIVLETVGSFIKK